MNCFASDQLGNGARSLSFLVARKVTFHSEIPMHFCKLSNKDWSLIEEHFQKQKLGSWKQGKLLSSGGRVFFMGSGGRLVLINSDLSSLSKFSPFFYSERST